jgi:1-acyl-sn-glycerol-3-phosphate acyltransferase
MEDSLLNALEEFRKHRHAIVAINHTSFMDALPLVAHSTFDLINRSRMTYKASLAEIPVWGKIYHYTRAFPVYFTKTDSDSFSVDRDKQAAVSARMDQFISGDRSAELEDGTALTIFPEGAINTKDPLTIMSIRHGTPKMLLAIAERTQRDVPILLVVQHGAWLSWPPGASMGGAAADLRSAGKIIYMSRQKSVEENAEAMSSEMQALLDDLKRKADETLKSKKKDN